MSHVRRPAEGAEWQFTQLSDEDTGQLFRTVDQQAFLAPIVVEKGDGGVVWTPDPAGGGLRWRLPEPNLLSDFLKLEGAGEDGVVAFARRHGVLGICKDGLPASHNDVIRSLLNAGTSCEPLLSSARPGWYWEPFKPYRVLAEVARAMLKVGADLHDGKPGCEEDWQRITPAIPDLSVLLEDPRVPWRRAALTAALSCWLRLGAVEPSLYWPAAGPTIVLSVGGLFGALGVQLLTAVASSSGPIFCSGCGAWFQRRRRPPLSQRRFCEQCGRKAAVRAAVRDYYQSHRDEIRERKREARARRKQRAAVADEPSRL